MAVIGKTATFTFDSNAVAQIETIDIGGVTTDMIDVTPLGATARKFLPGIPDHGDVSLSLYFGDNSHTALRDKSTSLESGAGVITFPNASGTFTFTCYVSSYAVTGIAKDGAVMVSVTLKIDGAGAWS